MKIRNATCVGAQTSKVPTRVAFLFISYFVGWVKILTIILQIPHDVIVRILILNG